MSSDYEVGYGKPPKHGQFKPGQSGNPKGRPKGTVNLHTDLADELKQKVTVTEGGKQQQLSKQRAMVKAMVNKAMKGDARARSAVITLYLAQIEGEAGEVGDPEISDEDAAILEDFLTRRGRP